MAGTANPEFLRRAIQLATETVASGAGGPFGAIVVRDGKIVGEGANSVTASHDPTAHAEVNAIRAAATALDSYTLAGCFALHKLRTVPHVPCGRLLGAP